MAPEVRKDAQAAERSQPIPFWKGLVLAVCAMQIGPALAMVTGYQLHWSGANAWITLGTAGIISCLIAVAISYMARKRGGGGSLLSYVQGVLPHWAVCLVASTLLLGYIIGPSTMTMWAAAYLSSILLKLGVASAASPLALSVLIVAFAVLSAYCGYRGLELSAKVSLSLGLISIPVAAALTIVAAVKHGIDIDYSAALTQLSWTDFARGTLIALGSFIGFDGVCALGNETANPARNVPKLLGWTVILLGLTNTLGAILQTPVMLAHVAELEAGQTPTYVLMHASGLDSVYVIFDAMLCMAEVAGTIAWLNLSALIVANAARDGFLPRALSDTHARTGSPYKAVFLIAGLSAAIPVIMQVVAPNTLLVSMAYIINVLVLYWMMAYALVCVAAITLHHRNHERTGATYLASLAAIVMLAIVAVMQDLGPSDRVYVTANYLGLGLLVVATLFLFVSTRHRHDALKILT